MGKIKLTLDDGEMQGLVRLINEYGEGAEQRLNQYIHTDGKDAFVRGITQYIPVSNRIKKHAKTQKWESYRNYNLATVIGFKRQYNYLYFPQTGTGKARKKGAQQFLEKGVDSQISIVTSDLLDLLMPF